MHALIAYLPAHVHALARVLRASRNRYCVSGYSHVVAQHIHESLTVLDDNRRVLPQLVAW